MTSGRHTGVAPAGSHSERMSVHRTTRHDVPQLPFRTEVMDAVADGRLPVRPGDMISLLYTSRLLLVVSVTNQRSAPAQEVPGSGQWIEYVVSGPSPLLDETWLSWHGFDTFWALIRS